MTLYIYNQDTNEIAAIVNGNTNEECEAKAAELVFDLELFAWAYNDNGLAETSETIIIE
jgi:hypothetical protein